MRQEMTLNGNVLTVMQPGWKEPETHIFESELSAEKRARFVEEAMTWVGTPFVDCADIKGPNGGVDCAMMLARSSIDTGLLESFDPRPYNPTHMQHSSEEKFIGWIQDKLGAHEVEEAKIGDVLLWQFGRCFCHGGLKINSKEVVHAYKAEGFCNITKIDTPLLQRIGINSHVTVKRPIKYFRLGGV